MHLSFPGRHTLSGASTKRECCRCPQRPDALAPGNPLPQEHHQPARHGDAGMPAVPAWNQHLCHRRVLQDRDARGGRPVLARGCSVVKEGRRPARPPHRLAPCGAQPAGPQVADIPARLFSPDHIAPFAGVHGGSVHVRPGQCAVVGRQCAAAAHLDRAHRPGQLPLACARVAAHVPFR
jgi:hypothetical protein